ncbi:glycosyltransferase family 22 protein [Karstenula rhodostoma CBS 690.94]|uniref:Mannosyltransferase n=1 Tax=Karstenula rhodostoma CBS 690.94 TaxID=1392251 RepID=A0A9P4PBG3_9PLEO|nr:glycosyltransferase family 22 protein [Karstenula rhodostoma CBS 690.94]
MPASDTHTATRAAKTTGHRDATLGPVALLLAFRIVNALTLRTFFQPDEFFQSLEPAWQLAFGHSARAWITWEWTAQLRSSLHPELFAVVYKLAAELAAFCGLSPPAKAELLLAAPKLAQAVFAALLDCYTWKLAEKAYGRGSRTAYTTLALSVCSPWQWFCATRTLSNCLETAVTAVAVYHWPWHSPGSASHDKKQPKIAGQDSPLHSIPHLRLSLLLAAFACILRPTNALVWITLLLPTWWRASTRQRYILIREISLCGAVTIACSVLSDRFYYQTWTFPPLRFLYFNIFQSLAVFYGTNRPDYYLTEGLPLLLTTALPFALVGLWHGLSTRSPRSGHARDAEAQTLLSQLAWTSLTVTASLTLLTHKEVRFLYPVLPFLHVLAAKPLTTFFPPHASISRKALLTLLLTANLLIAGYASQVHQRGVIDVLAHLRHKHEALNYPPSGTGARPTNTSVAFLMPCHSTPWRSHLVHASLSAWALTCEPPLNIPLPDRAAYLDEADQFFLSPGPAGWLRDSMEHVDTVFAGGSRSSRHWARVEGSVQRASRRPWPQHLVFFAQLEPVLREVLAGSTYRECWRGFNSHWHDDWRRQGDVLVWCLD